MCIYICITLIINLPYRGVTDGCWTDPILLDIPAVVAASLVRCFPLSLLGEGLVNCGVGGGAGEEKDGDEDNDDDDKEGIFWCF